MAGPAPLRDFALKVVIVFAIAAALAAAWILREAGLLFFGAVLFAIMFQSAAHLVMRLRPMPYGWALAIAMILIVAVFAGFMEFFGRTVEAETSILVAQLPHAWTHFQQILRAAPGGEAVDSILADLFATPSLQWVGQLPGYAATFATAVTQLILILVGGLYLAAQPQLYIDGAVRLLPQAGRDDARRLIGECGAMLRRWLFTQLLAMICIGVLFGVGLRVLGVPAAEALGLFAGLAAFIPLLGPVLPAIPALIFAASGGLDMMLWTLAIYVAIQLFESNVLQPLLQRGMTSIPPVVILFALLVFFAFFGVLGLVFAAPLTIVCMVAVRDLYLGERPRPPELRLFPGRARSPAAD